VNRKDNDTVSGTQHAKVGQPPTSARPKKWVKPVIVVAVVVIMALLPAMTSSPYLLHLIIYCSAYIVATVSLRMIITSGQFPLAHGAFMGIGAYTAGMTAIHLGWPAWFTIPAGAAVAGIIGMIFSYPFSRLRALYYAMGSLFFGIAVLSIIQSIGPLGRQAGLSGVPPIFSGTSRVPYYYLFLGITVICLIAMYRFEFSRIGTSLKAISQSHLVASSVGINEGLYRNLVVGVGCFFVGVAGAALAHYNQSVTPGSYDLMTTLWLTMYVLVGGMNSFVGPIIGAPILFLIPQYFFRDFKQYAPYITATILAVFVYVMPTGLVGLIKVITLRYIGRKAGTEDEKGHPSLETKT
jgi:branched-chain amino acid transport system permease protein